MAETFTTTLLKAEGLNATGISVPPTVVAALGKSKRPAVKVTLNGYTYRTTIAPYGDVFMLPVEMLREAAQAMSPVGPDVLDLSQGPEGGKPPRLTGHTPSADRQTRRSLSGTACRADRRRTSSSTTPPASTRTRSRQT